MQKTRLFIFVSVIFIGCYNNRHTPFITGEEGKPLPSASLLLPDSISKVNLANVPGGEPIVVFFFSPKCPYCRAQLREMTQKMDELKKARFYLASYSGFKSFKQLYNEFELIKYPNVTAGVDYANSVGKYFKLKGYPFTAIYSPQKKLRRAYLGKVSVDLIESEIGK